MIRPDALRKAGYKCSECKAKHRSIGYRNVKGDWVECDELMLFWCKEQGIKVKQMFLQVCHVDNNPSNNDPDNLVVKCPKHHLRMDASLRAIVRKSR